MMRQHLSATTQEKCTTTTTTTTIERQRPRRTGRSEVILLGMIGMYVFICFSFWYLIDLSPPKNQTVEKGVQSSSTKNFVAQADRLRVSELSRPSSMFIDPKKNSGTTIALNSMLYVGKFGLGHRLSKLVSAYHLVTSQPDLCQYLDEFRVDWGSCKDGTAQDGDNNNNSSSSNQAQEPDTDIFAYLYGSNRLKIPCSTGDQRTRQDPQVGKGLSKTVIIRNDVQGYYAGQSYKNAQIPLSLEQLQSSENIWNRKMDFDRAFFQQLLYGFHRQHGTNLKDFQQKHAWQDHYVVGLHLRAGNGEKDHFVQADRGVANLTEWCRAVVSTLRCAMNDLSTASLPVMVFLSTDTTDLIPVIKAALPDVPVVTFPQTRPPAKEGVSYQKWTQGEQCFDGWKSAMTDMALLAASDLLIAATRSTFTQILPMSQVLPSRQDDDASIKFCEMGGDGHVMTCFSDRQAWFLRQNGETTWQSSSSSKCTKIIPKPMQLPYAESDRVVHKVMVHLPDVGEDPLLLQALEFLEKSKESRFYYGPAFARKYRGGPNAVFRPEWTFS